MRVRILLAVLASSLAPATVFAQDTVPCAHQRIDEVVIHSSAPTVAVLTRKVPQVASVVRSIHTTTRPEVIRRFLLLREGDSCEELRRAESERILRAQPFLSDASVRVIANDHGGVDLDVTTADEVSLVLDGTVAAGMPPVRFVRIGNANISGDALYFAADWRDGGPFRDGVGAKFATYQLFGKPYTLRAEGRRNPLGESWEAEALHPFFTDLQRIAWQAQSGSLRDYVQFPAGADSDHALRVDRRYFDLGALARIGPPGRLSLFGASISGDEETPAMLPVLVTKSGLAADSSLFLRGRYTSHRMARVNLLWGVRDIGFVPVRAFDALNATQDLPIGFQLGTMFGRSLSVLGSRDDDIFVAGDLYVGAGGPRSAFRLQLQGEGRRSNDENAWDGILTTGRAVDYVRLGQRNTATASLEWSGGWQPRLPFSLTLSDPDGGVRGFASSRVPGAQRLVARLEHRTYIGRIFGLADFGAGGFVDAGRLWSGDVPYGQTTPTRISAGLSLFSAVPPGSARLWRLDLAVARNPEHGGGRFEVRLVGLDKTRFYFRNPSDVERIRERTVPSSIFRWP